MFMCCSRRYPLDDNGRCRFSCVPNPCALPLSSIIRNRSFSRFPLRLAIPTGIVPSCVNPELIDLVDFEGWGVSWGVQFLVRVQTTLWSTMGLAGSVSVGPDVSQDKLSSLRNPLGAMPDHSDRPCGTAVWSWCWGGERLLGVTKQQNVQLFFFWGGSPAQRVIRVGSRFGHSKSDANLRCCMFARWHSVVACLGKYVSVGLDGWKDSR